MNGFAYLPSIAGVVWLSAILATPLAVLPEAPALAPSPVRVAQAPPDEASDDVLAALRNELDHQDWQAADRETRQLLNQWIHPNGDIFAIPLVENIPADQLQVLDQLWLEASDGRFSFSVQAQIWQEVMAQYPNDREEAVRAFGQRVGWMRPIIDHDNFVSPEWFTEPELTQSLEAPAGHFPWVGISWSQIQAMLNAQSCGSCMIDAMYLQDDRFYRYLPALYSRVEIALANPEAKQQSQQETDNADPANWVGVADSRLKSGSQGDKTSLLQ